MSMVLLKILVLPKMVVVLPPYQLIVKVSPIPLELFYLEPFLDLVFHF